MKPNHRTPHTASRTLRTACLIILLILNSPFSILHCSAQSPNCYRITFSDKNNSPYSIERPEEYLSPRAIAKRERFNIAVTEQDLPVNPQYIEAILNFSTEPAQIISTSKWNNSVVIFYPETENCHDIINEMITQLPFVVDTLPVAYYQLPFITGKSIQKQMPEPRKSIVYSSSSCDYDYGKSIVNIRLHKGEFLHKAGFCGEGMLICAFDSNWSGLDTLSYFKPLYDNGQMWGTRDLIPGVGNVYIANDDNFAGHGTSCFSDMASCIEGTLVGTAPQANYFLMRTENPWGENLVEEDFWAQGAEIADSLGADVISSSVGYKYFDYEWQNIYTSDDNDGKASIASRAASILAHKGVIVVQGAGNEGNTEWHYIGRPADAFDILAVGNVSVSGYISYTSSYGPSADGRIKPDVAAAGGGWCVWRGQIREFTAEQGGCSGATPKIAGLAACLWQALPQYSALEIMDFIRKHGNRSQNPDDRTGYGIPDFYQCYLDHHIGVSESVMPEFSVYPNPTAGELQITNYELQITNIEVFDVFGRAVLSHTAHHIPHTAINISHLPAGIYILKVVANEHIYTHKIVKI